MLQIVISNSHLPENIPYEIDDQLPAFLAQSDETKNFTTHNPEIDKWAVNNEELNKFFDSMVKYYQFEKDWVVHSFFKTIAFVDHRFARKVLNVPYKSEEEFWEKFEKVISKYRSMYEINYIPFCMSSTIFLAMLMAKMPRASYDLPDEMLQYIMPVSNKSNLDRGMDPNSVLIPPEPEYTEANRDSSGVPVPEEYEKGNESPFEETNSEMAGKVNE